MSWLQYATNAHPGLSKANALDIMIPGLHYLCPTRAISLCRWNVHWECQNQEDSWTNPKGVQAEWMAQELNVGILCWPSQIVLTDHDLTRPHATWGLCCLWAPFAVKKHEELSWCQCIDPRWAHCHDALAHGARTLSRSPRHLILIGQANPPPLSWDPGRR